VLSAFCFCFFRPSCSFPPCGRPRLSLSSRNSPLPPNTTTTHHHLPPTQVIGSIDGSGRIRLVDSAAPSSGDNAALNPAVDLDLEKVLGSMPQKTFSFETLKRTFKALELPEGLTAQQALEQVLRLPSVCSKRFLTTKVDRHVTGE
jgi:phosphoribosylformylglycinamidine (FGAM) synthase-like enzyme